MKMTLTDKYRIFGNAILFQALWFAAVIGGGGNDLMWPAWVCFIALMLWARLFAPLPRVDLQLALAGMLFAYTLEPVWLSMGLLSYPQVSELNLPPTWISMLWVAFAVSIQHSLAWLKGRYFAVMALGFLGGLSSISAAIRLDIVTLNADWLLLVIVYGGIWSLAAPALFWLASRLSIVEQERLNS